MRKAIASVVDRIVALESAAFERRARSLDEIGKPILVASHQRSGTHLTMDTLRRNCPECRARLLPLESLHHLYLTLDCFNANHPSPVGERQAMVLLTKSPRPMLKTHERPDFPLLRPEFRELVESLVERSCPIYVVRNGIKVMCSLWMFRRAFSEAARVPFADFMRQENDQGESRARAWASHVRAWQARPGVTVARFEDLISDPRTEVERLATVCGVQAAPKDPIIPVPVKSKKQMLFARLKGEDISTNIHAKGARTPKPKEVFGDAELAYFEQEAGNVMRELGYEIGV